MDVHKIYKNFVSVLKDAERGEKTVLPYIKNELPKAPIVADGEAFQVMVIGGTNYRKAQVRKEGEKIAILHLNAGIQPRFNTKEDLFTFLDEHILDTTTKLGLNFAYALTPTFVDGVLDGALAQSGTKENAFEGLLGKLIGKEYNAHRVEKGKSEIHISVANDTICLLLSGLTEHTWEDLACGIVGTGINFAFFENQTTAVNLESADFDTFEKSEAGLYVDNHSQVPGHHPFEKEAGGGYLYLHFNYFMEKNGTEGKMISSTEELEALAQSPDENATLAKQLLDYSADLAACQIAGIMLFKKSSLNFVMQGSLFSKSVGYNDRVLKTVQTLTPSYVPTFLEIEHADLIGAAKLLA